MGDYIDYKLFIRQEDIANGEKLSNTSCPVALAAQREFKRPDLRVIDGPMGYIVDEEDKAFALLGMDGAIFAKLFDTGHAVKPQYVTLGIWKDK